MNYRRKSICISIMACLFGFPCYSQTQEDIRIPEYNACAIEKINLLEYDLALDEIAKIIRIDPFNSVAYLDMGLIKNDYLERYMDAIQDFTKVIELDSLNVDAYFLRGISKYNLKKYQDAIVDFVHVTTLESGNADAYYYKGLAEAELGNLDSALVDYTAALAARPDHANATIKRAWILATQKHAYQRALTDCNESIAIDPTQPSYYYVRGWIKAELFDFKGAVADYKQAIQVNLLYDPIYDTLAARKHTLADYKTELRRCSKEKINQPADTAYFERGILMLYLHRYKQAIKDFDNVLLLKPKSGEAYYKRAFSKEQLKNYAGAIADYEAAIDAFFRAGADNPSGTQLLNKAFKNRAELKLLIGDYPAARLDYDVLIKLNEYNADYYLQRGKIEIILKDKENACRDFYNYVKFSGNEPAELILCK